jgi:arabinogalactan endo-1,4-beta-galactosidase
MKRFLFITLIHSISLCQPMSLIKGVDISMLEEVEDNGGAFYENGVEIDPIQLFKSKGVNTVRLKIWHNPSLGYNNLESILEIAHRLKDSELDFLLNFHYSDTWADPSNQNKPLAWQNLNFETLCDSIYIYSSHVISKLKNQNTLPSYVQIGNETDCGILWPDGYVCNESDNDTQWENLRALFTHAIEGIHSVLDINDTLKIISHVSSGGSWFFDHLMEEGLAIDLLGLSYYPMWHGSMESLDQNIYDLGDQFQKPVLILETAYPFTLLWNDNTNNILGLESQLLDEYEATPEGQFLFLNDLFLLVSENEYGSGILYWSPEWISTDELGSPWENQALFDFNGEMLNAVSVFDNLSVSIKEVNESSFSQSFNYPNPFNSYTLISYELLYNKSINIDIYDIKGSYIKSLFNKNQSRGIHSVHWDGTNNLGENMSAGMYIYTIQMDESITSKKMIMLK